MSLHSSDRPPLRPDPFENTLEAVIGQMITRERLARDAVKLLQPKCRKQRTGHCTDLVRAETAAEVWRAALQMLGPVLKGSRS